MSRLTLNFKPKHTVFVLVIVALLIVAACTSADTATTEPTQEPTQNSNIQNSRPPIGLDPTATVPPPAYREPITPITLENVTQIEYLGRLDTLGRKSTIFNWAISPDGVQMVALNNDLLTEWNLVTGITNFTTSRADKSIVLYSADKTEIYAIDPNSRTHIYRSVEGDVLTTLKLHDDYSGIMAYAPSHSRIALAGSDNSIKVWDLQERVSMVTFTAHRKPITNLAFTSDGTRLATASADGTIKLWDWQTKSEVAQYDLQNAIAINMVFSPDDSQLAVSTKNFVAMWDVETSELGFVLQTGEDTVNELLKFSPDGTLLATAGNEGNMRLWNTENSNLEVELPNIGGNRVAVAFSPDNNLLVTTMLGDTASLWNLTNITERTVAQAPLNVESSNLFSVEWSIDGYTLLFFDAGGEVYVWGLPAVNG